MKPPVRRTLRVRAEDVTEAFNQLIRQFVEDGYKRVRLCNPDAVGNGVYVTVSGIK